MAANPHLKRQVIVLLVSLLVSILASALPDWASISFSTAQQILLGVILFGTFVLLDVLFLCNDLVGRERKEVQLWAVRSPVEQSLVCIRTSFEQLIRDSFGKRDLFVTHFMRELTEVESSLRGVAEKGELRVRADHFLSVDNVLDAFQGDQEPVWRYTWLINSGDKLFDDLAWRRYFERTSDMLSSRKIHEVRVLLVFDQASTVNEPSVQALLKYFSSHRGFSCTYMLRADYASISADNRVPPNCLDFGIYGGRLLFLTEQYEPEVTGVFSKDANRIQHYTKLFDSLWGSISVAKKNSAPAKPVMTLESLFEADA